MLLVKLKQPIKTNRKVKETLEALLQGDPERCKKIRTDELETDGTVTAQSCTYYDMIMKNLQARLRSKSVIMVQELNEGKKQAPTFIAFTILILFHKKNYFKFVNILEDLLSYTTSGP